jgi:hypothetical protein
MTESTGLLSPTDSNLKSSERCAYREGRKAHEDGLDPFKALDIGCNLVKATGKPVCTTMEALYYFSQGILGETCEIYRTDWIGRDFCKEGCKLECEYRSKT